MSVQSDANKLMYAQEDCLETQVNGKEVTLEEAYDAAARILTNARNPLI